MGRLPRARHPRQCAEDYEVLAAEVERLLDERDRIEQAVVAWDGLDLTGFQTFLAIKRALAGTEAGDPR